MGDAARRWKMFLLQCGVDKPGDVETALGKYQGWLWHLVHRRADIRMSEMEELRKHLRVPMETLMERIAEVRAESQQSA